MSLIDDEILLITRIIKETTFGVVVGPKKNKHKYTHARAHTLIHQGGGQVWG